MLERTQRRATAQDAGAPLIVRRIDAIPVALPLRKPMKMAGVTIGTAENLVVNANGGDDTFTASNGLASLISITVDGGPGNDTLLGGDGAGGWLDAAGHRVRGGAATIVLLTDPAEDEDVVVHRQPEQHHEHEQRQP